MTSPPAGDPSPSPQGPVVVLIPVYNDWESLAALLPALDDALAARGVAAEVLVVDDGSTERPTGGAGPFRALGRVDVLHLRRNLGHQRAIAVGLAYLEDRRKPHAVVVMDGDGEDDPVDVPRLLDRMEAEGGERVVFAERTRRSESWTFRVFYALYKAAHRVLTGRGVRVGNFSAVPARRLASLVVVTELWNHYAAAVVRSRQPACMVPTHRARRLRGQSSMNFVGLVIHGLSAISVYSDVVGVRLLILTGLLALVAVAGMAGSVAVRLATDLAIPGWATYTFGLSLILLVQAVLAAFVISFVTLGDRNGSAFIPRRDYGLFVGEVSEWAGASAQSAVTRSPRGAGAAP